jgi:hypothetical protein
MHNEELHNLYTSPNVIRVITSRKMKLAGNVAFMGEMTDAYNILVVIPEEKTELGRPRHR